MGSLYNSVKAMIEQREKNRATTQEKNVESGGYRRTKDTATKVEDLQTLFETRLDFLKRKSVSQSSEIPQLPSSSPPVSTTRLSSISHNHVNTKNNARRSDYKYKSAFSPECQFTNWNNDFRGTLDYIFVSEDIKLTNSRLISSKDHLLSRSKRRLRSLAPVTMDKVGYDDDDVADDDDDGTKAALKNGPFPSTTWPSDHLLLLTSVTDIA